MDEYIKRTEELMLAMNAGARAIENTRRYHGAVYIKGLFSETPREIPYLRAVKVLREVSDAPAADVAPVVYGRWICEWDTDLGITTVICSRCKDAREVRGCYVSTGGEGMYDEDAYCPNCGAKMDGERKDGGDG